MPVGAASPFDGRWRPDVATMRSSAESTVIALKDGVFTRDGGDEIAADGKFHAITGDGYIDEIMIDVIDDRTVRETDKVHGKIVYTSTYMVSATGDVLRWHVTNVANPKRRAARTVVTNRRIAAAPVGSHAIAGSWQKTGMTVDPAASDWILELDGDRFSSWSPDGVGFEAILGGPAVPITGDEAGGSASVTRRGTDTIVKTSSLNGVVGSILVMTILSDGKTIRVTARAPQRQEVTTFTLHKQ